MLQLLTWIQFIFTLTILTYTSISDWKKREVPNQIWIFTYPIACLITLIGKITELITLHTILTSLLFSTILGLTLFFAGLYGGADVKALLFIGLSLPLNPFNLTPTTLPFVFTVFCNATLLCLVYPLAIFILNLKDTLRGKNMFEGLELSSKEKTWLFFTTRKISKEKISLKHLPAETIENKKEKPVRKTLHFIQAETDLTTQLKIIKENKELYKTEILTTPTIPSICFFTIALITGTLGNLLIFLITTLQNIIHI